VLATAHVEGGEMLPGWIVRGWVVMGNVDHRGGCGRNDGDFLEVPVLVIVNAEEFAEQGTKGLVLFVDTVEDVDELGLREVVKLEANAG
jgi:hypothetical protein